MSEYGPQDPLNRLQRVYTKYSSSSGSKEYENASLATDDIRKILKSVRDSVTPERSFDTKFKAMSVILQISNEIVEGDSSTLGSEIRKDFWFQDVGSAITHIFNMLTPEEVGALQADGSLADDLLDARAIAKDYALDVELDDIISRVTMDDYMSEDGDDE